MANLSVKKRSDPDKNGSKPTTPALNGQVSSSRVSTSTSDGVASPRVSSSELRTSRGTNSDALPVVSREIAAAGTNGYASPRVSSSSDRPSESIRRSKSDSSKRRTTPRQAPNSGIDPSPQGKVSMAPIITSQTVPVLTIDRAPHESPIRVEKESENTTNDSASLHSSPPPPPTKSESNGFLSSILNAAHNAANIIGSSGDAEEQPSIPGAAITSTPEKQIQDQDDRNSKSKKDTFSNRFDFLLKPARFGSSRSSTEEHPRDQEDSSTSNGQSSMSSSEDAREPSNLGALSPANVQFEPVRESPLNSLGQGNLTLDSFEQRTIRSVEQAGITAPGSNKEFSNDKSINAINTTNSYSNIASLIPGAASTRNRRSDSINRRLMITPNHSTDNLNDFKRGVSPDIVNRAPNNSLLPAGGTEVKKLHRRSIGSSSNDLVKLKSQTSKSRSIEAEDEGGEAPVPPSGDDTESDISGSKEQDSEEVLDLSKLKHAPKKKNKEFHNMFKSVPSDDKLVEDVSCALSKDFLVQGRMYISDQYICFNSNILGWVTNLSIPLQEVIQIEKKSTAVLFPNGMIIRTLHHRYVFATFLSRDTTFNLIKNIWQRVLYEDSETGPSKRSKIKRKTRRNRGGSKSTGFSTSESRERETSNGLSEDDEISDYGDDDTNLDFTEDESFDEVSANGVHNDAEESSDDDSLSDSSLESDEADDDRGETEGTSGVDEVSDEAAPEAPADSKSKDGDTFKGFPVVGPLLHAPTSTGYTKEAAETFICDEVIKAPLGVVFSILFGSDTSKFIKILKTLKNFDLTESGVTPLSMKSKSRNYTYIKPLNGAIGPKQTKCVCEDKLVEYDLDKYILVLQTTGTPDVPSGSSFKVRTKVFLSWAAQNQTRFYVVTVVEWTAKSWIKGAIERGSIDGQKESMKSMVEQVNEMIAQGNKDSASSSSSKNKSKTPKKKVRSRKNTVSKREKSSSTASASELPANQGILEQFTTLLETIGKSIPVSIPFVGDLIMGALVVVFGIFVFMKLGGRIIGNGGRNDRVSFDGFGSSDISGIMINNEKYLVIPSIEASFSNKKKRMDTEVELWNWIRERSEEKVKVTSKDEAAKASRGMYSEYSDQEIREIIDVTKLKLEKLSERLNIP